MTRIVPALMLALALMIGITIAYVIATAPDAEAPPATSDVGLEGLQATLWVQSAAEYEAAARQAYVLAGLMLQRGLEDRTWSAAIEQAGNPGLDALPPAVILDVDETVLDNSASQARLILDHTEFGSDNWDRWVLEARAAAVPGALEFTRAAAASSVTVFYVTNRRAHLERATRQNLTALGFPIATEPDVVLMRDEQPDWGSDKGTRRARVARDYRILLLIGDNFGDFLSGTGGTPGERAELVSRHAGLWGQRWIVLPNPQYGSWDGALIGYQYGLSAADKRRLKLEALNPARGDDDAEAR